MRLPWRDSGGRFLTARIAVTVRNRGSTLEPVLLLADNSRTHERVEAELRKRYGTDYQVITARSVKAALEVLGGLCDTGRQVSLVLADQWLPGATGTELLAQVRQLHPSARRVLLITWGDQASLEPMLQGRLESLILTDLESGTNETVDAAALFVLIGAEPRTQWLPSAVRLDQWGFVVTGTDLLQDGRPHQEWPLRRMPMLLESSLPGVFAVGDVRHGSVKRVAAAVGEGSIAIRLVHDHLRDE